MSAPVAVAGRCDTGCIQAPLPLPHHRHRRHIFWQHAADPAIEVRHQPAVRSTVAAASGPERLMVTGCSPPPPPPEVGVRVIGIGSRGASAISKLIQHGKVDAADTWCLDVDKTVLDAVPTANTLLLSKDDFVATNAEGRLSAADLQRIVGRAASDAGGRGNINAGTDGAVAFVLGPAATPPGGAAMVLQIMQALRAAGHFTVAAVTLPFGFEGATKQQQAADLITVLQQTAHMVAVMEQNVLMQAFGDAQMTVSEAKDIADNSLEHSVRCILQAIKAQEILRSSHGALMWHGRDLRQFKRILSPPLQQLLTQPGTAVLGRGLASMSAEAAHQMGAEQALMHLSSDAVRAAAESPFLEGALSAASGVLCSINLPSVAQQFSTGVGSTTVLQSMQTASGERRAVHLAAQAAAGALGSMSGPWCHELALCAEPRPPTEALGGEALVQVEVTLLVLRLPAGHQGAQVASPGGRQRAAGQQTRFGVGPAVRLPPRQPTPLPQRLPASSWNMLSAMAGGTGAGSSKPGPAAGHHSEPSAVAGPQTVGGCRPAPVTPVQPNTATVCRQEEQQHSTPNIFGEDRPAKQHPEHRRLRQQQAAACSTAAQHEQQVLVQQSTPWGQASSQVPVEPESSGGQRQKNQQHQQITVADYLVNSLTAQSLDLPPAAARWRQEYRGDAFQQRKLIVWEVDDTESWEEEEEAQGLAALLHGRRREKRVNIKERMASILMQDREDAWEANSHG